MLAWIKINIECCLYLFELYYGQRKHGFLIYVKIEQGFAEI